MAGYNRRRKKEGNSRFKFLLIATLLVGTVAYFMFKEDPKAIAAAENQQQIEEIKKIKEKKIKETVKSYNKNCDAAELAFAQDEFIKSRDLSMAIILDKTISDDSELWKKAAKILNKSNSAIINSSIPLPEKKVLYTVKSGDALARIAKKFNTTVEAIQKGNGLTNNKIFPRQTLYIYKADWNIKISKKKYRLYLYDGENIFKIYGVGLGKQNRTPVGTFKITNKTINPPWYYRGKTIPHDSPDNPLGTRWMSLEATGSTSKALLGYGIHGTRDPSSIGKNFSNGCIRMKNEEVEELFTLVPYGKEVVIEE